MSCRSSFWDSLHSLLYLYWIPFPLFTCSFCAISFNISHLCYMMLICIFCPFVRCSHKKKLWNGDQCLVGLLKFDLFLINNKNQQTRTKWFVTCSRSFSLILSTDTDMVQNPYCACMRISIPFHARGHTMLPSLFIMKQKFPVIY